MRVRRSGVWKSFLAQSAMFDTFREVRRKGSIGSMPRLFDGPDNGRKKHFRVAKE